MEDELTLPFEEFDEDELSEALAEADRASDSPVSALVAEPELLTVKLIREAVRRENPNDAALEDFARVVVPNMMRELAGHTAKGGAAWIKKKLEEGIKSDRAVEDQSLTAHLLNGLLPVTALIRRLRQLDTSVARYLDESAYRFYIAAYILHDWEKLPGVAKMLETRFGKGFKPDPITHRDVFEQVLLEWAGRLGLDEFLAAGGLGSIREHLDTLAWITQNTQERYDTHRPTIGFRLTLDEQVCELCANLTKLSDKLASIVKHPADISQTSLTDLLHRLSDGQLRFTYHGLAEVRGVLTNIINNALLDAHREKGWEPLLFFPNGVAYLGAKKADAVEPAKVPDAVVTKIRQLCSGEIEKRFVGFERDKSGKGLKFADYYPLFFDPPTLIKICAQAALSKIHENSRSAAADRSASIRQKGSFPEEIDVAFSSDIRIDQLAEFCNLVEQKIWQENGKADSLDDALKFRGIVLDYLGLMPYAGAFELVDAGVRNKAGGVPLAWYYISAQYFKDQRNTGKSANEVQELITGLATRLADRLKDRILSDTSDGWSDMRQYVASVLTTPSTRQFLTQRQFLSELERYEKTKLPRSIKPCSLCSSPYKIDKQKETGILFAPQVFTNKQTIFGSEAKRHICSICMAETMLRQILMLNPKRALSGGSFEDAKYRYLYIYPTYYFTAETSRFLRTMYQQLRAMNFRTGVRDHLVNRETREIDFSVSRFQSLDSLLTQEPEDRLFKMQYPEDDPMTFFFAGIPQRVPKKDEKITDTESWVMPTFLALVLPFVFDAKVVVSESPIPLFNSGAEFEETVFVDAPHSSAELLITKQRLRLDEILPKLQRLTAAYVIQLDANSKKDGNPNWGQLSELARDLTSSPLYVFHYLNVWLRQKTKLDGPPPSRVRQYLKLYDYIDWEQTAMNHPRRLTELYRRFYRAKGFKSNAILKPIDFAADTILKADRSLFPNDSGALTDAVAASLNKLLDRVLSNSAEGYSPMKGVEERRLAVREFAEYFVNDLFFGALKGDAARLAGQQLNLIRDTCDTLYREMGDRERAEKRAAAAAAGVAINSDDNNQEEEEN